MRQTAILLPLLGVVLWSAVGQSAPPRRHRHVISPRIRVWLASDFLRRGQDLAPGEAPLAPVSIRFGVPPGPGLLRRLEGGGVSFLPGPADQGRLHLGPFYPARITAVGLRTLERHREHLRQVDLDVMLVPRVPLDLTGPEVQADDVWPRQVKQLPLTGQGMVMGSIDSGVDLFHPAFFRADGGVYHWIDVDGDGSFDPGKDAVDLNRDGQAAASETLRMLEAGVLARTGTFILTGDSGTFTPDRDWLYADQNANNKRDFGPAAHSESTPALGEPLFVAEDLDGDGQLDPEEGLRRLKTSKIKAYSFNGVERKRGTDLIQTVLSQRASHGTGTAGIMLGGQRGRMRWTGLAPDAELMMANTPTDKKTPISALIIWLVQAKAHVVLHEYAPYTGYHLDGSSNHESLMDQGTQLGVPQVTPAGNLRGAAKHIQVTVPAGQQVTVPITVPPPGYLGTHYYLHLSLLWRQPAVNLGFVLEDPNGKQQSLPINNTQGAWWPDNKSSYYSYRTDSPRGTARMDVILYNVNGSAPGALPQGGWSLQVANPSTSTPAQLWGYLGDALTSWNKGIAFDKHTSDKGLICFPATADSAITLGAYAGHVGSPYEPYPTGEQAGDLRGYSSRGIRIDGKHIMDVAAPDNPVTPINHNVGGPVGAADFQIFGGTSGAGPHVAAAALLVRQHDLTLTGAAVRAAIRQGAVADSQVGAVPSDAWGMGKLRIYRSIFGTDPQPNTRPDGSIEAPAVAYVGDTLRLVPRVTDAQDGADALRIRWDVGYDGSWDGAAGPVKPLSHPLTAAGSERFRLMVQDTGGLTAEAAVRVQVLPADQRPDQGVAAADGGPGDGGDGGAESDDGCGCLVGRAPATGGAALLIVWLGLALGLARIVRRRNNAG